MQRLSNELSICFCIFSMCCDEYGVKLSAAAHAWSICSRVVNPTRADVMAGRDMLNRSAASMTFLSFGPRIKSKRWAFFGMSPPPSGFIVTTPSPISPAASTAICRYVKLIAQ